MLENKWHPGFVCTFFYKFIHVESKTSKMRTCMCIHIAYTKGLVTNYGEGGLQNWRRGAREVLPL